MKWARDPKAEFGLKQLGIDYDVATVRLCNINVELSMERQARIGKKLNDDWVLEFAQQMENGAEFPMPILQLMKKDNYFIFSGNHRTNAAKLKGESEISAYIVKVTDQRLLDILPRVVNTWEGHRESRDSVLEHARYVVETHGYTVEQSCNMFGLQPQWLWQVIRANGVQRAIEETGIRGVILPKTALIKLAPLADNKNVLKATVKLFKDHSVAPTGPQAVQILDDVKKGDTEAKQLAEVNKWNKLFESQKTKTAPAPTLVRQQRTTFLRNLTNLDKFLQGVSQVSQLQLDPSDHKIVDQSWDRILQKMVALLPEEARR